MRSLPSVLEQLKETITAVPPLVSFEFFPPKTGDMEAKLWETIKELDPLKPRFVSVTYGAGGSTRERTRTTVKRILDETSVIPAAHLTCVAATQAEIEEIVKDYWQAGIRHLVALRGDTPGGGKYTPHPDGYAYADDLVKGLKKIADFEISVAAYPETHPDALSAEADLDHLKRKVDAGATRAITQYCFDTDTVLRFLEKCEKVGVKVPIVPGILPVSNFKQTVAFSERCGASVPKWMHTLYEGADNHPHTQQFIGAVAALEQCRLLQKAGINEFHFYTLNRAELTTIICHMLGIKRSV